MFGVSVSVSSPIQVGDRSSQRDENCARGQRSIPQDRVRWGLSYRLEEWQHKSSGPIDERDSGQDTDDRPGSDRGQERRVARSGELESVACASD